MAKKSKCCPKYINSSLTHCWKVDNCSSMNGHTLANGHISATSAIRDSPALPTSKWDQIANLTYWNVTKKSINATYFQMHLRRHTGERNYPCPVCGKAFARSDGLRKHLSCYHGGMKPFQCPVCQRSFKGHFLQHLRTHTDEKPFSCETCGHSFAQRSQLKVHMRTHTGERPVVVRNF